MPYYYSVEYEIRDKNITLDDYIKEREVDSFLYHHVDDVIDVMKESYPQVIKEVNITDSAGYEKLKEIVMSTDDWDYEIMNVHDHDEQTFYYIFDTLDTKYDLLRRYIIAFKLALLEIEPHPSLAEEGNPKVLDQYLKWLEDIYKEINPENNPPKLSEKTVRELNSGDLGHMGTMSTSYMYCFNTNSHGGGPIDGIYPEHHPSVRFDFLANDEKSFKTRIKDILLNKNIFYRFDW
jgi:hypothetical protein